MLQNLRKRAGEEKGFTLIEVLVAMAILGLLAAIALPQLLGEPDRGYDSTAKSNARNLVSHVELCYAETHDFRSCDSQSNLGNTGTAYGSGPDQAEVVNAQKDSYEVVAVSKATSSGQNHTFTITRSVATGQNDRECSAGPGNDAGGCSNGSW